MDSDQRLSPRKVLKVKAVVVIQGGTPLLVRTMDISANGVGLLAPKMLQAGATGQIAFDLYFDGKSNAINTRIKIVHCIYSNGEFKTGVQFTALDPAAAGAIARYLQ